MNVNVGDCKTDLSSSHPLCKKSTEQMKKIPTIVLSVSYKGVKFIDATNKVLVYNLYLDCKSNIHFP